MPTPNPNRPDLLDTKTLEGPEGNQTVVKVRWYSDRIAPLRDQQAASVDR